MAAAFVRMERRGFAEDLLKILDTRLVEKCRWKSNSQHSILSDDVGTTALALWSYAQLRRDSATTAAVANHLLAQTTRIQSNRSLGTVVAALSEYYNQGERSGDDFTIELLINDQLAGTIKSADLKTTQTFAVAPEQIDAGENRIRIKIEGRGEVRYAATLSGFSPDLKDPETLEYPRFANKGYYHDKLAYREVPLTAYSSSPVTSLEIGQRFRTQVSFYNNTSGRRQSEYLVYEEHIPTGTLLVAGSLSGNYKRVEIEGSKIRFYFAPGHLNQITYELVAHAPGKYRVLPGIVHDAVDRSRMRVGKSSHLEILKPAPRARIPTR